MLKKILIISILLLSCLCGFVSAAKEEKFVTLIPIPSPIAPIAARVIVQAIDQSAADSAEALIIELDTPGGLDESMRQIVREILNSKVPVIVYVSPGGARAASAGVFITLAAHIAAMAPGTNIGAA